MQDAFYIASKTVGQFARLETWLLLVFGLALWALIRRRLRIATVWLSLGFGGTLLVAAYPLGDLLLAPLEGSYPADPAVAQVDDIIVLGGDEDVAPYRVWNHQLAVNDAGERLIAGAVLARRFPGARLIFSGGSGSLGNAGTSDEAAEINRDGWLALGVAADRITLEQSSLNTSQNATMTRDLIHPQPGQTHLLVTSAYHMPRAMETFARAGWTGLVAWPVDFRSGQVDWQPGWHLDKNLLDINTALKEYVGLLAYRIAGK